MLYILTEWPVICAMAFNLLNTLWTVSLAGWNIIHWLLRLCSATIPKSPVALASVLIWAMVLPVLCAIAFISVVSATPSSIPDRYKKKFLKLNHYKKLLNKDSLLSCRWIWQNQLVKWKKLRCSCANIEAYGEMVVFQHIKLLNWVEVCGVWSASRPVLIHTTRPAPRKQSIQPLQTTNLYEDQTNILNVLFFISCDALTAALPSMYEEGSCTITVFFTETDREAYIHTMHVHLSISLSPPHPSNMARYENIMLKVVLTWLKKITNKQLGHDAGSVCIYPERT